MNPVTFVHEAAWSDFPAEIRNQARRCLLDIIGAGVGGRSTPLSQIIHNYAVTAHAGQGAHLWFDGRTVSPPGAALANGMTIDSLDIHDGHPLTKGHAGAAIVPALLATVSLAPQKKVPGQELLTSLVVGYEVALRAGIALHATVCDYHTSGAWNALGCAALTARRTGLSESETRHALGIAEYHGPRSQMMRCIDYPTMLKDGSGWGAMAGVSAALLARAGFSGAPAVTIEAEEAQEFWQHLGQQWQMMQQYFKPHAVCRWAQPAVEGALAVQRGHQVSPTEIRRIKVFTFHEAVRLNCRAPKSTEAAQYSLPFPVAAALVFGRLGPAELSGSALNNSDVLRLASLVELIEDDRFNQRFPARRFARVEVETGEGTVYRSREVEAEWDAVDPPTDQELRDKFRWLAGERLPESHALELEQMLWRCAELPDVTPLLELIAQPPN